MLNCPTHPSVRHGVLQWHMAAFLSVPPMRVTPFEAVTGHYLR
jgi:hypothetical protein